MSDNGLPLDPNGGVSGQSGDSALRLRGVSPELKDCGRKKEGTVALFDESFGLKHGMGENGTFGVFLDPDLLAGVTPILIPPEKGS